MSQRLTLVFLVLLRMAIGWHFLFEGVEKQLSVSRGETINGSQVIKPWTSEPYFREGTGPLAKLVKSRIGDPDDLLLARLTPREPSPGEIPAQAPARVRLPEALDKDWEDYLARFTGHYELDTAQQNAARAALDREKDAAALWLTARPGSVRWLLSGLWTDTERAPFKRTYPGGTYDVEVSVAERAEEYRARLAEYRSLASERPRTMGKDVTEARRTAVRAEVGTLRGELQKLLDQRSDEMKKALAAAILTKEQIKQRGPVPAAERHWLIRWIDFSTRWGLMIMGGCLLLGLFSRTAAISGALFLLMTLLTHPPLPWLPAPPNAEGHYVFITKNVIELLALVLLACIPSGRWFGIDALVHAVNPWRRKDAD